MSNPLFDLQEILAGKAPVAGKVIAISGGLARVATSKGVVEVSFDGSVGDRVVVRDGQAVRVQDGGSATVYYV